MPFPLLKELSHMSEALLAVPSAGTVKYLFREGLDEKYGVPFVKTINPLGIAGLKTG